MRMAPQTGIGGTVGALYTRAVFQASSRPRTVWAQELGHRMGETAPDGNGLFVDWREKGVVPGRRLVEPTINLRERRRAPFRRP